MIWGTLWGPFWVHVGPKKVTFSRSEFQTLFGRLLGGVGGRGGPHLETLARSCREGRQSSPARPAPRKRGRRILLSFAPSAAAGWHGERQRIPYAKNRARRSVFSSVGLCRRFSHQIALHCIVTKKKTECSPFFGTVPPVFPPKTVEKQGGMLAFFCISSASKLIVFPSMLVSFSLPRAPLEPPGPPFFPDGAPGRFFYDF